MLTYDVDGRYFTISPEEQEDFLAQYPEAKIVSDESQVDTEIPVQETQFPEQDMSMPGGSDVIQTPMGFASTEESLIPDTTVDKNEPDEEKPPIKPISISGDNINLKVGNKYFTVHKDEYEDFLTKKGYSLDDVIGGDEVRDEEESDISFNEKVKDDGGVSNTTNKLKNYKGPSTGQTTLIKEEEEKLDNLIKNYQNSYKDTNFEFEKTSKLRAIFGSSARQAMIVRGENGVEKVFNFNDGDPTSEINKFILENQDIDKRDQFVSGKEKTSKLMNNLLVLDNIDDKQSNWRNMALLAYDPSGLFTTKDLSDPFGEKSRQEQFDAENYESLNDFLNDNPKHKDNLAKVLRERYNQTFGERRFSGDFTTMGEYGGDDDELSRLGVSEYQYDQIFKGIINNKLSEESVIEFEQNRVNLQEELNKKHPDLYKNINLDEIDYRDFAEYDELSKFYFDQTIKELDSEQLKIHAVNTEAITLAKRLSDLREDGEGGSKEARDLEIAINELNKKAEGLLGSYVGEGATLFFDYTKGRIVTPKNEQEIEQFQKNQTYRNVLDLYNTYSDEFYNIKTDGSFQDLEERYNFNSLEKNQLSNLLDQKFDVSVNFNNSPLNRAINHAWFEKLDKKGINKNQDILKDISMRDLIKLRNMDVNFSVITDPDAGPQIATDLQAWSQDINDRWVDNEIERKALIDWYVLNTDPANMRRTGEGKGERGTAWQDTKQFFAGLGEGMVETWTEDYDTIHSRSDKLDVINRIGNEINIPWTEDQQKNFVQTTAEFSGQTLGAVPQIAVEFAILNAVTGGIATATGLTESLALMRMGRVIHKGKAIHRSKLVEKVYAATGSKNQKAINAWLASSANKYKNGKQIYKIIDGGTTLQKAQALGITMMIEEGKMQFMDLPTGTGAAFAFSGAGLNSIASRLGLYFTAPGITPAMKELAAARAIIPSIPGSMTVGTGINLVNKSLKLARTGPQFAISAEFASNVEAMIEDIAGGKDMQTFIDEHYRELSLDEKQRRTLGNILTGYGFGIGHSKTLARGIKGDGWAFTRTQIKNIQAKARKIILEESAKPEQEQNQEKIHKYSEIYHEMQRQIDVVSGIYKNDTAQLLKGRVKRYINKKVDPEGKDYSGTHVQMGKKKGENGAKYNIQGDAEIMTTKDGKRILVFDALKFTGGKFSHDIGHKFTEDLNYTKAEFEAIKKIIQPEVEANAKEWLKQKNKEFGTEYESVEELINKKYSKVGQTEALAEEYVMRVVQFFGDKTFTKGMIKGNAFFGINKAVKQFYEKRLQKEGFLDKNFKEVGLYDAQDVMKALNRIANWKGGKKEVLNEWKELRNLVQFSPTGEIVNIKTGDIIGKNRNKSSLDLLMEEGLRLKEDKVRDEQIYQRTDRLWNEKYDIAKWRELKKDPTKLEIAAYEIAFAFEGNIIGRLEAKRDRGELKGFTKGEIETIAMEFITAKSGGLVSAIKAFTPSKMINPQTGKPSLATYFNSRVPNQKGSLIDVKLSKFYTEHPKFGRFFKELGEVKELVDTDAFRTEAELGNNKRFERAKIDPLNLVSYDGKNLKTNYQTAINSFYDKLSKKEKEALNLPDMKDLAPEVTAEFFGINSKKLKDFYEGKTKYIHDFTYSDKVEYTNPEGKTEIMTLDQANKKGLKYGVDVFIEPSEVTNIQKTIRRNAHELLSLLPERNVVPKENIDKKDVDPNLVGKAIGIKGKYLDFYEPYTDPKALSSDPVVRKTATTTKTGRGKDVRRVGTRVMRLKPEFLLKDTKAVEAFLKAHGITPPGKPNKYNKAEHGAMLTSAVRLFPKFMSVKAVGNRLASEGLTEALNNIKAGISKRSSSLNLFEEGFKELLEKNNKIVSEKQVLKLVNKITDPIIRRRVKVAIKDTYTIFDTNRDIAITKEARRRIEELDILETAKLEDLSISEVIKRAINAEKNYKQSYDNINKVNGLKGKDKIVYRTEKEILTSKHYKEFKKVLGDVATRLGLFDPNLGATQKMEILRGLGWNKFKVVLPNGEIGRLNNEALGFKKNVDLYKTYSEKEINAAFASFFGIKPSKSTLSNDSRQPKWDTKGLKAANKKGIALGSKEAHTNYIENYLKAEGKSYEETVEANRYNLTENYKVLFDILVDASRKKGKIKGGEYEGRTELSRALELVTEYMRIQTSIGDGSMKGLVPVIGVTTAPARSKTRTETKEQHNEHARELFNVNTKDMLPVFTKYLNNPKKGYEAIRKLVDTYGQILTSAESMSIKDNLLAYFKKGGEGVVGMESYNVILNTILSRGQGDNIILLGKKGKTVNEFLREKYLPKDIKMAIKRIGDGNLNAEGIKVKRVLENQSAENKLKRENGKILEKASKKSSLDLSNTEIINEIKNIDKAIELAKSKNKKRKGISVLDFDDTVAKTKSKVIVYAPAFKPGTSKEVSMRLTPAEFAKRHAELERMGASFDFSEFTKVIKGKKGPLFDKLQKAVNKFGNENVFILTARPQESAAAIQAFLEGMGVKLKIKNITGLEDGKPGAKAQWMINKAAEGYNDFYFADDAIANVRAVKRVLDIVDVKSKIQQARKSSIDLNADINAMIEYSTGIGKEKVYSAAKAELAGKRSKYWNFIASRAGDFGTLTNAMLGTGVKGLENRKWFEDNIVKPFAKGDLAYNTERRNKLSDYYALRNQLKETGNTYRDMFKKSPLNQLIEKGEVWTNQHAARVYNWAKQGTLPKDISKTDVKKLVKHVNNNPKLKAFAEELVKLHKGDGYPEPREHWLSETITQDILLGGAKVSRKKYMKEFIENADIVFSPENLNKMEAAFGKNWRTAMEGILETMKTGSNRPSWGRGNKWESNFLDWINGSVGATMFINTRSALLQQVSMTNYLNVTDNNPIVAAKAFANTGQFIKDYKKLMNDQWSLNRRDGLRYNIQEAELAELVGTARNKGAAFISYALKKGFIFTKYADSHATAFGGASFYRNRANKYMKEGMSKEKAEQKALEEWREMSDATQQTSRMDRVSQEQRSVSGRLILPFSTVQLAYGRRYVDDAARDLINKRYDHLYKGENSALKKIGQIAYGTAIQGAIFHALQQGVFKVLFEDGNTLDGEELEVANATLDSALLSMGIVGRVIGVAKNWLLKIDKEMEKNNPDYRSTLREWFKISPPMDRKVSQIEGAIRGVQWADDDDFTEFSLDNPILRATTKTVEATTNAPIDALLGNLQNIEAGFEKERDDWQRPFLFGGWPAWIFDEEEVKKRIKSSNNNPYLRRSSSNPYSKKSKTNPYD